MQRTGGSPADCRGQGVDGDPLDGSFSRRIDVGEDDLVGRAEGRPELFHQVPGTAVAMGLEGNHDPSSARPCCRDHGCKLGGVMPIIVNQHHTAPLATPLEAPLGPGKFLERRGDDPIRHLQLETHGHGPERIEQVVPPGDGEAQGAQLAARLVHQPADDAPRAERLQLNVVAGHVRRPAGTRVQPVGDDTSHDVWQQVSYRGVIRAQDGGAVERHLVHEFHECQLQRLPASVRIHVLAVDIRDERHGRRELQERAIAFVRLHHHRLTAPQPRVAAERAETPPDHGGRVQPGPFEHERDHRRRCRLAVGPRHGDAVLEPHELREHLRPRNHRHPPAVGLDDLHVVEADRGGHHHHVGSPQVPGVVPGIHPRPEFLEACRDIGAFRIGPTDLVSHVHEQLRDAAHPYAANPDEVHVPCPPQHLARRQARTLRLVKRSVTAQRPVSSSARSTITCAASGRASRRAARPMACRAAGSSASAMIRPARRSPVSSRCSISSPAPASAITSAFFRWWLSAAVGNGTRIDGLPAAVSSASVVAPARQTTRSAARTSRPI